MNPREIVASVLLHIAVVPMSIGCVSFFYLISRPLKTQDVITILLIAIALILFSIAVKLGAR